MTIEYSKHLVEDDTRDLYLKSLRWNDGKWWSCVMSKSDRYLIGDGFADDAEEAILDALENVRDIRGRPPGHRAQESLDDFMKG